MSGTGGEEGTGEGGVVVAGGALQVGGPYRAAVMPVEAPAPKGFQVREVDGQLVIEQRLFLSRARSIGLGLLASLVTVAALIEEWALVGIGLFSIPSFLPRVLRTTLTLGSEGCIVERRRLLGAERFAGSSLEIGEPVVKELTSEGKRYPAAFGVELSVGGRKLSLFDELPRERLEWVAARLAAWRRAHVKVEKDEEDAREP